MKAVVIKTNSQSELKSISDLIKQLGLSSVVLNQDEVESLGIAILLKEADKARRVSKNNTRQNFKS